MKVWFIILSIHFEYVKKRFNIFFFYEFKVFGKSDSEDGDDCSFFDLISLFFFISDEIVPQMGKSLRFDDNDIFAH